MKRDYFARLGMLVLTILLLLNLAANSRFRATAQESEAPAAIHYQLVRVDSSTNEETLFKDAGQKGYELVGTIQVSGSTAWLVFRR
jgi:hypothetical protein